MAVIGAPSSAGARLLGQEEAPEALRAAGLVSRLEELGFEVADHGNVAKAGFRPDPEDPTAQNAGLVCRVARESAEALSALRNITRSKLREYVYRAASSAGLGDSEVTEREAEALRALVADFDAESWVESVPYRLQRDRALLLEALRAAGL